MGANTDPRQFILFPDPMFSGPSIVTSVTSQDGKFLGQPVPDSDNEGDLVPFVEGDPDTDLELQYRVRQAGGLYSATWTWRDATNLGNQLGQSDCRFIDHVVAPFQDDEFEGYGLGALYSSVFNRLLLFRRKSTGSPQFAVRYKDMEVDTSPRVFSSDTLSPQRVAGVDTRANIATAELPDGALRVWVQFSADEDESLSLYDLDEYSSLDGGLSWTRIHKGIFTQFGIDTVDFVNLRGAVSGDWIRLNYVDLDNGFKVHTVVSSDRGASYLDLGRIADGCLSNAENYFQYVYDVVGLGDTYGSFLMAVRTLATEVKLYTATADQAWQELTDFTDFFGSLITIRQVVLCKDEQRIYAFAWYASSGNLSRQGWLMRSCLLTEYTDISKWSTANDAGTLFPRMGGTARYFPSNVHAVFAGHRIVFASALVDAEASGNIIAYTAAWHQGGWSQRSFGQGQGNLGIAYPYDTNLSDAAPFQEEWLVIFGRPAGGGDSSAVTRWTQQTAGSPSVSWTPERLQAHAAATEDVKWRMYYGPAPSTSWGHHAAFFWSAEIPSCPAPGANPLAGARFHCLYTGVGATIDLSVRYRASAGVTAVYLYDEGAGATIYSETGLEFDTKFYEWRLGIEDLGASTKAELAYKNIATMTWTTSGSLTVNTAAAGVTAQLAVFGILNGDASVGITVKFADFRICGTTNLAQLSYTASEDLLGRPCSPNSVYVYRGISARWGGGGGFIDDRFDAPNQYANGMVNLFLPSPALPFRTSNASTQQWVFDAGADKAWIHDGVGFFRCQTEQAIVEYADDSGFSSLIATETCSFVALPAVGNTITMIKGDIARFQAGSPVREQFAMGELEGYYVRRGSGTAQTSFLVTKHLGAEVQAGDSTGSLVAAGFTTSFTHRIVSPDAVHVYSDRHIARYMRVTMPAPSGQVIGPNLSSLFSVGAMVVGTTHPISVPLDWVHDDSETPNVEITETPGGQRFSFVQGEPRRRVEGRIVGDVNEYRQELRGLLSQLSEYNDRPIVLVLDDQELTRRSKLLYGRFDGPTALEQQGWYVDSVTGRRLRAGDVAIAVDEEK